jgi:RNA polymerase sigma-70 factor, ECF subfamily
MDQERLRELTRRSARGQEDAFAELYDLTAPRVYGVVLKVLRSPELAAEVSQEVFVEVWRSCTRYDSSRGSVLAWMITIAHRRAVDRVRSTTSEAARDQQYGRAEPVVIDDVWETTRRHWEADRVREGLHALTEVQREALTLAYFGGYTQAQVAQLLQVPLGTVKTRMRDGLIRLRDELEVQA